MYVFKNLGLTKSKVFLKQGQKGFVCSGLYISLWITIFKSVQLTYMHTFKKDIKGIEQRERERSLRDTLDIQLQRLVAKWVAKFCTTLLV